MRAVLARLALALALSIAFIAPVAAGPYEDGYAAYKRGDLATAERLWRPLAAQGELRFVQSIAERGDADAQALLGYMYYTGRSPATGKRIPQDYAEAVKWFRRAADGGSAISETMLGAAYAQGHGVPQDYVQAVKWVRLAAEQGLALGQYALGAAYAQGQGVPQNYSEAERWYRLAADQGNDDAKAALADLGAGKTADSTNVAPVPMGRPDFRPSGAADARPMPSPATVPKANSIEVALEEDGGTFLVPVLINNLITLKFVLDSGAADVSIPADVAATLMRAGTIAEEDFLGTKIYALADGSTAPSQTFRIRSLKVGNKVLENVVGSISPSLVSCYSDRAS